MMSEKLEEERSSEKSINFRLNSSTDFHSIQAPDKVVEKLYVNTKVIYFFIQNKLFSMGKYKLRRLRSPAL
jgi:hypothetical protein